jgi:hypothetical protein
MKFNFLPPEVILSKFNRDIKSKDCSEADLKAWIGEAMDFIKIPEIQELKVSLEPVKNYSVLLPNGFQKIQQIAKYTRDFNFNKNCESCEIEEEVQQVVEQPTENSCEDSCEEQPCYRPYFDMQWQLIDWSNLPTNYPFNLVDFVPVRLANNNFFGSLVCQEIPEVREYCRDEYTIVGVQEKVLRFSFQEGWVLISYYSNIVEENSGMPLIPDIIQLITAITYYIQWKIAETLAWQGREGFSRIAQEKNMMWERYIGRARSAIKMLSTVDEYQDIMEQSLKPNINFNSYNNFFHNLTVNKNL